MSKRHLHARSWGSRATIESRTGVRKGDLWGLLREPPDDLRAIEFAGGDPSRVIILSIPDWGVTPFGATYDPAQVAGEIDAFNAVALEETTSRGAQFVDITPISRRAADDLTLLAADGLHPSDEMYREWVELVLPIARLILSR